MKAVYYKVTCINFTIPKADSNLNKRKSLPQVLYDTDGFEFSDFQAAADAFNE